MTIYFALCYLSAGAVLVAYLNQYILRVHSSIAITASAMLLSFIILISGKAGWFHLQSLALHTIESIDFKTLLLQGVLGFLLFAGGIGINLSELREQKWEIFTLATFATFLSTFLIATGLWCVCYLLGFSIPYLYCLLFGALISPTDPIAVLAIVKKLKAPKQIAVQVEGESLFNDGVGLVIFVALFTATFSGEPITPMYICELFLFDALGGIAFGLILGFIAHFMICYTKEPSLELLITLCIPTAGFALANQLGISAALAMVVSGIVIGNWSRAHGFSDDNPNNLDHFWHLIDEYLNALLFLLIGLSLVLLEPQSTQWLLMLIAIPLVLVCRYISVAVPYIGFKRFRDYHADSVRILTWGGLRGGLAMAMALSLPQEKMLLEDPQLDVRALFLMMTYGIVMFSILVQGTTITSMIQKAKSHGQTD